MTDLVGNKISPEYWHIDPPQCDQRRNWCRVGCFGCKLVINDVEDDGCHTCRTLAEKKTRPSANDCTGRADCECQGCWYLRGLGDEDS